MKKELYTGYLKYKSIDFSFVFDGTSLSLIPPKEKEEEIEWQWLHKEIRPGCYVQGDSLIMENSYLVGKCNENNKKIIFLTQLNGVIGRNNLVLHVPLIAYIVCKIASNQFCGITFCSHEIDYVFPTNQVYNLSYNPKTIYETGITTITTETFQDSSTPDEYFKMGNIEIMSHFSSIRKTSFKPSNPPLTINSCLVFKFKPTESYDSILQLVYIAKQFISYLSFRNDIAFTNIFLSSPYSNDKTISTAELILIDQPFDKYELALSKGRYIKAEYIKKNMGRILESIANNTIYTQHIAESFDQSNHINAATFILTVAAFEWEFKKFFPSGFIFITLFH